MFDPIIHYRKDGIAQWAALTAFCRALRPQHSAAECKSILATLESLPAHTTISGYIARNLLHDLWTLRDYETLHHAATILATRQIGEARGLPDAYIEELRTVPAPGEPHGI